MPTLQAVAFLGWESSIQEIVLSRRKGASERLGRGIRANPSGNGHALQALSELHK